MQAAGESGARPWLGAFAAAAAAPGAQGASASVCGGGIGAAPLQVIETDLGRRGCAPARSHA